MSDAEVRAIAWPVLSADRTTRSAVAARLILDATDGYARGVADHLLIERETDSREWN